MSHEASVQRVAMPGVARALALCAFAGGLLRIADSFAVNVLPAAALPALYLATDIFLLAGMAGIWWQRRQTLGIAGAAGLVIFACGIVMIRASAFGVVGYQLGATVALLGFASYSVETLIRRSAAPWAPLLWLLSLALGIAGVAGLAPQSLILAAGVVFGAGFVAAGIEAIGA